MKNLLTIALLGILTQNVSATETYQCSVVDENENTSYPVATISLLGDGKASVNETKNLDLSEEARTGVTYSVMKFQGGNFYNLANKTETEMPINRDSNELKVFSYKRIEKSFLLDTKTQIGTYTKITTSAESITGPKSTNKKSSLNEEQYTFNCIKK